MGSYSELFLSPSYSKKWFGNNF